MDEKQKIQNFISIFYNIDFDEEKEEDENEEKEPDEDVNNWQRGER